MEWHVYRPNDGSLIRRSAMLGILAFTSFACMRWHAWMSDSTRFFWPLDSYVLPTIGDYRLTWGLVGLVALMGMGLLGGYLLCFAHPKASTFLIETENELRKVTWPAYKPWFSSDAEVWGSTYVVFVVLVVMALFLLGVDTIFQTFQQWVFIGK